MRIKNGVIASHVPQAASGPEGRAGTARTLDVGCGPYKIPGAVGIDQQLWPGVDVVYNLERYPWPFADGAFERVICRHSLGHLSDVVKAIEEIHRVLRPGGRVEIVAPHFSSDNAFVDPTRRAFFGYRSMDYFCANSDGKYRYTQRQFALREVRISFQQAHVFEGDFKKFNPFKWVGLEWLINRFPRSYEHFFAFMLRANELYFCLQALSADQAAALRQTTGGPLAAIERQLSEGATPSHAARNDLADVATRPRSTPFPLILRMQQVFRQEGLAGLLRKLWQHTIKGFLSTRRYIVFGMDLDERLPVASSAAPADLFVIESAIAAADLLQRGYDYDYLDFNYVREFVRRGNILFCIFSAKRLVHNSWVSLRKDPELDIFSHRVDYSRNAYISNCYTHPRARGLGLYGRALAEIGKWLHNAGVSSITMTVEERNRPSISAITKAGFDRIGKAEVKRIFFRSRQRFSGKIEGVWEA